MSVTDLISVLVSTKEDIVKVSSVGSLILHTSCSDSLTLRLSSLSPLFLLSLVSLQLMTTSEKHRTVKGTDMNERSSRSHTVFQVRAPSSALRSTPPLPFLPPQHVGRFASKPARKSLMDRDKSCTEGKPSPVFLPINCLVTLLQLEPGRPCRQ
eukprot:747232-Hanusia_phi.AAC.1